MEQFIIIIFNCNSFNNDKDKHFTNTFQFTMILTAYAAATFKHILKLGHLNHFEK